MGFVIRMIKRAAIKSHLREYERAIADEVRRDEQHQLRMRMLRMERAELAAKLEMLQPDWHRRHAIHSVRTATKPASRTPWLAS